MARRLISDHGRHTGALVWIVAILCAILAIAVIIGGILVFTIYLIYQPRVPYIKVASAQLNALNYDQSSLLEIGLALTVVAQNDNRKAHASFSDLILFLQFHGIDVAVLRADPFNVVQNNSYELDYVFQSAMIPLDTEAMDIMDMALKQGIVPFDLNGRARTQWRVGIFLSVKYWTHLNCKLHFFWPNGSAINSGCSSKSD